MEGLFCVASIFRSENNWVRVRVSKFVRRVGTRGVYSDDSELIRMIAMKGSEIFMSGVEWCQS